MNAEMNLGALELNTTMLESLLDLVHVTDEQGTFLYANQSWRLTMGLDLEQIKEMPVWNLFKTMPVNAPQAFQKWVEKVQNAKNTHIAVDNLTETTAYKITISIIRNATSKPLYLWVLKPVEPGLTGEYSDVLDYAVELEREKLEDIIDSTNAGTWEWDIETETIIFNRKWAEILGYKLEEISPVSVAKWETFIHPDDLKEMDLMLDRVFNKELEFYSMEVRIKHRDGHWVWVLDRGKVMKWSQSGSPILMFGTHIDISETVKMREHLHVEKELFRTTLMSVGDGVIATDSYGRVVIMNQVAEYLTGWALSEVIGKPFARVFIVKNEHTGEPSDDIASEVLQTGETTEVHDLVLTSRNGREIPIEKTASPIKDSNNEITGVVVVFRDFTEKKEKQKEVEYLSFHDHLTGLYNRRYMDDALDRMDTERNLPFAIMVLDVNGLKLTNDAFGHEIGDKLLKAVAEIIHASCRADDVICRTGGDEFAILLPNTNQETAEEIRKRILVHAAEKTLDSVIVSIAVGYDVKEEMDKSIRDVLKHADNHMYQDKMQYGKTMRNQTIETVLRNVNQKYDKEKIHTERVSQYAEKIAIALGRSETDIEQAKIAGVLHDIGKIMVPAEILNKSDPLTEEEWEEIRKHPVTSYHILKAVDEYASFASAVLYHHERVDGKGYPKGLKGPEIPMLSKILSIADAYEAMTSDRTYRNKMTKEEAIEELRKCSGSQFDPDITEVFITQVLK